MKVFLVRHAIAHERNRARWPNDALRQLTPEGIRRFRRAARGLATLLPKAAVLLTSPYVRARDTAAILKNATGLAKAIECPPLAGDATVQQMFELLRMRKEKALVLVGHEPNLSAFLSAALAGGEARLGMEFKKGGAACLEFPKRFEAAHGMLIWMLPPRVLRGLTG